MYTIPVRTIVNSFVFQILFDEEALEMFENVLVRETFPSAYQRWWYVQYDRGPSYFESGS